MNSENAALHGSKNPYIETLILRSHLRKRLRAALGLAAVQNWACFCWPVHLPGRAALAPVVEIEDSSEILLSRK